MTLSTKRIIILNTIAIILITVSCLAMIFMLWYLVINEWAFIGYATFLLTGFIIAIILGIIGFALFMMAREKK
jgi:hypothetical protein